MIKLKDLIPLNLNSEKEKFFASNFQYNPQFVYEKKIDQNELIKYGKPKLWYLFLARRILKKYHKSAKQQFIKNNTDRPFLSQEEVNKVIFTRLTEYGLEKDYQIVFRENFVSRMAINLKNKEIKVALPIKITSEEIAGVLAHEIDTHLLRQHNYEKQPWFGKKKKYGFKNYLKTEEGLAIINAMVSGDNHLAYKSAINYLAVDLALRKDFVTVFNFLYQIWQDPERTWTWTLKKKRGLTDTSQRGAYTKDIVYFEGLIRVLNYLRKNNYDPKALYCGKIDIDDLNKVKKLKSDQQLLLPKYLQNNPEVSKTILKAIYTENFCL